MRHKSDLERSKLRKPRRLNFETLEVRQLFSSDGLYFTKDIAGGNDRLITVSSLTRNGGAVTSLASQPGYVNVDTGDAGLNVGVIDAAYVSGQATVAIGGDLVQSYDGTNINQRLGAAWDPDGVPVAGVDALAIGDFGALSGQIVISRETLPGANDVLILSTNALSPGSTVAVAGGPAPGGTAHGLVLGDFQPANPGNEVLVGFSNPAATSNNGYQLFYTTSGSSGQYLMSRTISDVATGDLNGAGNVDYILTGMNNVGASGFGQGSRIYEANGASGNLKSSPGISGPHNPPSFNTVDIGNLDGDGHNEIVLAGNDFVRVLDNNGAANFDILPPLFQSESLGGGAQFVDVVVADADHDGVNEVVAVTNTGLVYMYGHSVAGDATSPFSATPLGIYDTAAGAMLGVTALARPTTPSSVVARRVFYNDSQFDGNSAAATTGDNAAIATDKTPLLPNGTATFANYTSYTQGINGIMIDVDHIANPAALSPADFDFRVGDADEPIPWGAGPQPINNIAADVRIGGGVDGSDRITLVWDANAVKQQWLQVTVKATANTGLLFDDVFYLGNAVGETGNLSTDAAVDTNDVDATVANPHGPFNPAAVDNPYDFNRDGLVTAADIIASRDNATTAGNELGLLLAPLPQRSPIQIVESDGQWLQLKATDGTTWNFTHATLPGQNIASALGISTASSPQDVYFTQLAGGSRLYVWGDGKVVPEMPHTHVPPTVAVDGDILVGDMFSIERNPMTLFMRQQTNLSASATTTFYSAQHLANDVNGGAGIVLHPDHHQDTATFPGDPASSPQSGALQLIAYGQGAGAQSNAILIQTRSGPNTVADRMLIKDGVVTAYGNIVATGTITSGSSRQYKQDIQSLTTAQAAALIAGLDPVSFEYIADPTQPRLGFIAEDVPSVFGTAEKTSVDPLGILAALTLVVQQQDAQLEQLSAEMQSLRVGAGQSLSGSELSSDAVHQIVQQIQSYHEIPSNMRSVSDTATLQDRVDLISSVLSEQPTASSVQTAASELAAASLATAESPDLGGGGSAMPTTVIPFQIEENAGKWLQLQGSDGTTWNFDHFSNPALGFDSALSINMTGSARDLYIADEPDGTKLYLWNDGLEVPTLTTSGAKPDFAVSGGMLFGDIITIDRQQISAFVRERTNLSASASTSLYSARYLANDVNGGAGIVMHPDHHQDLATFANDPVDDPMSGTLQLIGYGQGSGSQADGVVFQTRSGAGGLADRMLVKDGTVRVYGSIVATGSVTAGSSREFKQDIASLTPSQAGSLIASLNPVSFAYTADPSQPRLGFIAEDVPTVFGTVDKKGVDTMGIVAALTLVVQQQQAQIDTLTGLLEPFDVGLGLSASGATSDSVLRMVEQVQTHFGLPSTSPSTTYITSSSTAAALSTGVAATGGTASSSRENLPSSANADAAASLAPSTATGSNLGGGGSGGGSLPSVTPFQIGEDSGKLLQFTGSDGATWNFDRVSKPSMGINSALDLNVTSSPLDLYLADSPTGTQMYLWEDGRPVPTIPLTGNKPDFAVWGDILVGNINTTGRGATTNFARYEGNLSASSATVLFSANKGINTDVDGGAGVVLHPDHHQDLTLYPGDPADHGQSGALQLIAYGQGSGTQANSIVFQSRSGPNTLADRMLIKGSTVTVYGNVVATGSITPGSSRDYKQGIQTLSAADAKSLIASLSPVSFVYTADPSQPRLSFIAEDVPSVFGTADKTGVDPMGIAAALTLVVQQHQAQINGVFAQYYAMMCGDAAGGGGAVPLMPAVVDAHFAGFATTATVGASARGPMFHAVRSYSVSDGTTSGLRKLDSLVAWKKSAELHESAHARVREQWHSRVNAAGRSDEGDSAGDFWDHLSVADASVDGDAFAACFESLGSLRKMLVGRRL